MNTPAAIIAQMRRIAKVDTSQYSDANALIDLNTLKDEFWSAIVTTVNESYNWDRWTADTVALQSEYTLPAVAFDTAWNKLLKWISMNYDSETYPETWELIYVKAREINPNTLDKDWYYYTEYQSEEDPIYFIADNSFFIAPAPRTAITWGIKLTWIKKIPDYELTTTEANMKITVDQQNALVYGLVVHWLMNKWADANIINDAEARWIRKRTEALKALETRLETPHFFLYPDQHQELDIINQ